MPEETVRPVQIETDCKPDVPRLEFGYKMLESDLGLLSSKTAENQKEEPERMQDQRVEKKRDLDAGAARRGEDEVPGLEQKKLVRQNEMINWKTKQQACKELKEQPKN